MMRFLCVRWRRLLCLASLIEDSLSPTEEVILSLLLCTQSLDMFLELAGLEVR